MSLENYKLKRALALPAGTREPLAAFLRRLTASDSVLLPQIVYRVGQRLDREARAGRLPAGADEEGNESIWTISRKLVAYWSAGMQAAAEHLSFSFGCDKSRIFGHGTHNGCVVLRTGAAWWAPPQVSEGIQGTSRDDGVRSGWLAAQGGGPQGKCSHWLSL